MKERNKFIYVSYLKLYLFPYNQLWKKKGLWLLIICYYYLLVFFFIVWLICVKYFRRCRHSTTQFIKNLTLIKIKYFSCEFINISIRDRTWNFYPSKPGSCELKPHLAQMFIHEQQVNRNHGKSDLMHFSLNIKKQFHARSCRATSA